MDGIDRSEHYSENKSTEEHLPSLLTIIFDTNPAAWTLISDTLPLSYAIGELLFFINAHLACNYANQVAVIASHCDKASWLYPSTFEQVSLKRSGSVKPKTHTHDDQEEDEDDDDEVVTRTKRVRLNASQGSTPQKTSIPLATSSTKYRPFTIIEDELLANLNKLISSTSPEQVRNTTTTKLAGAFSLALSYINRQTIAFQESRGGVSLNLSDQSTTAAVADSSNHRATNPLQARILIITLSPSADLAHQYIPIMNNIFACQRMGVPVDVLQLPLLSDEELQTDLLKQDGDKSHTTHQSSTVFLQQAADATNGIFIPARLRPNKTTNPNVTGVELHKYAANAYCTYLMTAFMADIQTRALMYLPTRIDVDFRAACFCHRNVIDLGWVCSICLSIFCEESVQSLMEQGCLTCGTRLSVREDGVGGFSGGRPVVVRTRRKKKQGRT